MARLFFLAALLAVGYAKPKEDERACEGARARLERRPTATVLPPHNHLFGPAVCKAVIDEIDKLLTVKDREDVESVEKVMQKYCDTTKGKDKTMCYYMGIGDATSGTAGSVKRDISSSLTRGINAKRLCNRLKTKDAQMCELKYEKKIDVKNTDLKLREGAPQDLRRRGHQHQGCARRATAPPPPPAATAAAAACRLPPPPPPPPPVAAAPSPARTTSSYRADGEGRVHQSDQGQVWHQGRGLSASDAAATGVPIDRRRVGEEL